MGLPIYPRKVKWLKELERTGGRIYSTGIAFAFLSANNEQVASFTVCRDYLHDMVFTQVNRWKNCYYACYDSNAPKISLTQARILVANTDDKEFPDRVERALKFIHEIECDLGIKEKSRAYRVKNPPWAFGQTGAFLFVGSSPWMLAGPMLGLYTLAMRIGYDADPNKTYMEFMEDIASGTRRSYSGVDTMICQRSLKGIKRLKEVGFNNIFYTDPRANYPGTVGVNSTHSSFGIASFSDGQSKNYIKFWYPSDP